MKKIFTLNIIFLLLSGLSYSQTTITSTLSGGPWNNANTWIGGVIPGAANNVIIQGPVVQHSVSGYTIYPEYCNDLTITSTGSLTNGDYGGGAGDFPVYVSGNVVNNGMVANGPEDYLKIILTGNLENNNIWMPHETEFQSTTNHNLSLAPGKSFGSILKNIGSASFTALTDLYFTCDWNSSGYYYRGHFYLNGSTLNMGNHAIELYKDCLINSGTLTGDFEINGKFTVGFDVNDTLKFVGNITVNDTLTGNEYGGGYGIYELKVTGNITNNGVIKDDYDLNDVLNNDDLNILVTGNIINNGIWCCNYTSLIGTSTQNIYQSEGKLFDGYVNDLIPGSSIFAQTDIIITKDLDLNGSLLDMNDKVLNVQGWLKDGSITKAVLFNGSLTGIRSLNNLRITGKVTLDENNIIDNLISVIDTLQSNEYGGGSTVFALKVNGDIYNEGVIRNINSGDKLSLEITGNIVNHGMWENSLTKFTGNTLQTISQSANGIFQTDFSDQDTISGVLALSDLKIAGNINLLNSALDMDNYEIDLQGELYNGKILSPKIKNALLRNIMAYNKIEIFGTVKIDNDNYFYGNLLVYDTLQSIPYGGGAHTYKLYVYGNVENNGLIRDEPVQGENFALYIKGDITNNGLFDNYRNYQLFYLNHNTNSISCKNTGTENWLFNGAAISGSGSASYSISAGGGVQNVIPGQTYDLSVLFTPSGSDTTAVLTINCTQVCSLGTIYLIGHNYNTTVGVKDDINKTLPEEFILFQNFPNPFNPVTRIKYQIPFSGKARITVFDLLGNEIKTLVNEEHQQGEYEIEFDGSTLSSGVYFYQLRTGEVTETRKMIIIK